MKIVFLETGSLGNGLDYNKFNELGEVVMYEQTTLEEMDEHVKDADILVLNKIPMNADTLKCANKLKLICVTATGTNIIDFSYTNKMEIAVANVKGYSTTTVAQHTFALYFHLAESMSYYDSYVKSGQYEKSPMFTHMGRTFHDLEGQTWGIVGLGDIGKKVAKIADTFGCSVIYYSTSGKNNNANVKRVEFNELLEKSDIISIHAPLNDATENLFNANAFSKMKNSSILLNLGRGPIVNEFDLTNALNTGEIKGAGMDVLCKEPMSFDCPLKEVTNKENLVITPHIAWASQEARIRLLDEIYLNIGAFLNKEERNIVKK